METGLRIVLATVRERALARLLDLVIALGYLGLAFIFLAVTSGNSDLALVQTILLAVIAIPAADALCTWSTGATPGKRKLCLGVSFGPEPYTQPPFANCVIRSLIVFYAAPLLPLLALSAARDPYLRGAHDTAAGTWVHKVVEEPAGSV